MRAALSAEGKIAGDVAHYAHIHASDVGVLRALGVLPVRFLVLSVIKMQVMVCIEEHHLPAALQHAHPLAIGLLGILQVPDQVPGDHHIEGLIGEFEILSVHPAEIGIDSGRIAIGLGLVQHGLGAIYCGDLVAFWTEYQREEPGAGSDIEYPVLPAGLEMVADYVQPVLRLSGPDSVHDRIGITLRPQCPVIPDVLQLTAHRCL